jgi:parvulin-like peptidyl-prolyl isomerase
MTTRAPADPRIPARPDRRPPYVRWTFYLLCVCLLLLAGTAGGLLYLGLSGARRAVFSAETPPLSGEFRRDLGGKLLGAGLPEQAVEQYSLYLAETDLPPERRANMAFTIGKLLMEQGRYEEALTWLYQVEMIDPKSEAAPEAGSKIVACLERLGRFAQAQYSLEARSSPDRKDADEARGLTVVARIGKDSISLQDLEEAIDALPPWMREPLSDPARKEAFLQQYVAEELLVRKARKLEMDRDPQVRKMADRAFRQLLVQKVLESELKEKVQVSADDVERYFQANQDRYGVKEAFRIRLIQVPADRLSEVQEALREGQSFADLARKVSIHAPTKEKGGLIEEWIEPGMDPTGMGDPDALWEALSLRREGELAGPLTYGDHVCMIRIEARREPKHPGLEEVRQQVEQDLYRDRADKATQELVQQALQVSDVKLFPEALGKPPREKQTPSPGQPKP